MMSPAESVHSDFSMGTQCKNMNGSPITVVTGMEDELTITCHRDRRDQLGGIKRFEKKGNRKRSLRSYHQAAAGKRSKK
jgi:hypothetical protein